MKPRRRPLVLPTLAWLSGSGLILYRGSWPDWLIVTGLLSLLVAFCCPRPRPYLIACLLALTAGGWHASRDTARWQQRAQHVMDAADAGGSGVFHGTIVGRVQAYADGSLTFGLRDQRTQAILQVHLSGARSIYRADLERYLPGDRVSAWLTVRTRSRPRNADARAYLKNAGLTTRTAVGKPRPGRWLTQAQRSLGQRLESRYGEDPVARELLAALLLGQRERGGPEGRQAVESLRRAGVGHLLAISGLHVGWVAGALMLFVVRPRLPRWLRWTIVATTVVGFMTLVGGSPSVQRAAVGCVCHTTLVSIGRRGDALNTLAVWAWLFVVWDPWVLTNLGFQFTFIATGAIVAGVQRVSAVLPGPDILRLPLSVSLLSYLSTAPLAALHFARLPPSSIVTNLLAVPLAMLATLTGYLSLLPTAVGAVSGEVAGAIAHALVTLARFMASLPYGAVEVSTPPRMLLLVALALLLLWALGAPRHAGSVRVGVLASLALLHLGPIPWSSDGTTVHVLDVGQGQAVVVSDLSGRHLLVDAPGGVPSGRFSAGASARVVLPWFRQRGIRHLDAIAISHADIDHAAGLPYLYQRFVVGQLWLPPGWHRSPALREAAIYLQERGGALRLMRDGSVAQLGTMRWRGLHGGIVDVDHNEGSLGLHLAGKCGGMLIPGDFGLPTEETLLDRGNVKNVQLLIAGHHGSRHSSGDRWLSALKPTEIAVSCGRNNRFGHPHPAFLDRAALVGAQVRRTDLEGTLRYRLGLATKLGEGHHQGCRDERQHEDDDAKPGQSPTTGRERVSLPDQRGMAIAEHQEQHQPDDVTGHQFPPEDLKHDEQEQTDDGPVANDPMEATRDGVGQMTAVQLPDGEQVQRGDQHADPAGADPWVGQDRVIDPKQPLHPHAVDRRTHRDPQIVG
ncbi:MAG: ComEC/Rec2 family competence protein [Acidobacteriota bacterium]|nr:ComEC/Rec2 family competence protein [Acidobacteriota bacterium]